MTSSTSTPPATQRLMDGWLWVTRWTSLPVLVLLTLTFAAVILAGGPVGWGQFAGTMAVAWMVFWNAGAHAWKAAVELGWLKRSDAPSKPLVGRARRLRISLFIGALLWVVGGMLSTAVAVLMLAHPVSTAGHLWLIGTYVVGLAFFLPGRLAPD